VSSTGLILLLERAFQIHATDINSFISVAAFHLGTMFSILFYLRGRIKKILRDTFAFMRCDISRRNPTLSIKIGALIAVSACPSILAAFFLNYISSLGESVVFIGVAFCVTALLIFASEREITDEYKTYRNISGRDALLIGLAQLLSVVPGLSRIAATTSVARARGVKEHIAFEFSLLLAVPTIFVSFIVTLIRGLLLDANWSLLPKYIPAVLFAAGLGVVSIVANRYLMKNGKMMAFAILNGIFGGLLFVLGLLFGL